VNDKDGPQPNQQAAPKEEPKKEPVKKEPVKEAPKKKEMPK
jgi:hypothetical protein